LAAAFRVQAAQPEQVQVAQSEQVQAAAELLLRLTALINQATVAEWYSQMFKATQLQYPEQELACLLETSLKSNPA